MVCQCKSLLIGQAKISDVCLFYSLRLCLILISIFSYVFLFLVAPIKLGVSAVSKKFSLKLACPLVNGAR